MHSMSPFGVDKPNSSAKLKRPSSLAELRDRQRTSKMAKTVKDKQPSIASFFSPSQNNPFRPIPSPAAAAPITPAPAPPASLLATPVSPPPRAPNAISNDHHTFDDNDATRPYYPSRHRRDPLALLRSISVDAPPLNTSDHVDSPRGPTGPTLDVSSLVKSIASLNVCVQGTTLALDTRESAYRSQVDDEGSGDHLDGHGDGDDDDEADAWGDAAMSSDDGDGDGGLGDQWTDDRPAWFDALLSKMDHGPAPSQLSISPTDPVHGHPIPTTPLHNPPPAPPSDPSLLDLLQHAFPTTTTTEAAASPLSSSAAALALPRRLTFTSTHPSTSARLLAAFAATVHPISDAGLLASAFSAFTTTPPAPPATLADPDATAAAALVAHLHHYRFPPTCLPPATRNVLARTLAASSTWPPPPAPTATAGGGGGDVEWYMHLVAQWQSALRHLATSAPSDGFVILQRLSSTAGAAATGAGGAGGGGAGFVVAVQGKLHGAYVSHASRGMRKAMVRAGITGMRGVAGPGMVACASKDGEWEVSGEEEEEGARKKKKKKKRSRAASKLARQYVVNYDGEDSGNNDDSADDIDQDDALDSSSVAATRSSATTQDPDDPCMDPTRTSVLYVPPSSTHSLLAFLHSWPTAYNLQSAHAPDPELPVLLCAQAFVHASADVAKVTKCGLVSSAVHGEGAVRVQVDGWVLPHKVRDVLRIVVGGDGEWVHVGVTWEDGCGMVKEGREARGR